MTAMLAIAINGLSLLNRSGTGRVVEGLLDGLSQIPLQNIHFDIVLPRGAEIKPAWAAHESLEFFRTGPASAWRRLPYEQITLPLLTRLKGVHVLHSPAFVAPIYGLGAVESTITVHDLTFMRYPKTVPWKRRFYYRWAIGASIRQADLIFTDTEAIREEVLGLGVHPDRVHVLPLGVDERFFSVPADEIQRVRRKLELPQQYLLTVGTVEPRKNLETLLDVMERDVLDIPLVIAGRLGWKYGTLRRRLGDKRLRDRARLLDYVADEDLPALYAGAAVFVAPSFYEGFGLTVLEAMASGCPVVASDIPVHREVGGDTITYVETEDVDGWIRAIESGIGTQGLSDAMDRAREFSWQRHAEMYVDILGSVMGK